MCGWICHSNDFDRFSKWNFMYIIWTAPGGIWKPEEWPLSLLRSVRRGSLEYSGQLREKFRFPEIIAYTEWSVRFVWVSIQTVCKQFRLDCLKYYWYDWVNIPHHSRFLESIGTSLNILQHSLCELLSSNFQIFKQNNEDLSQMGLFSTPNQ